MELKEYLFKFFRFNRNSDKLFAYTFFPMSRYKIIDINTKKIMEILYELSDIYYEYSFDNDKITLFNEFIFNEDKCIISKDLSLGIFYDFNKKELYFFNDKLLRALPFDIIEIGLEYISYTKDIVEKYYLPKIINPTSDFEHLIHCFIFHPMAAGRGDYNHNAFNGLTKDEREVFMDIIIDLGSYNSSLFSDASNYFNEDKMTNYLKLMEKCNTLPYHAKKEVAFKLFSRTKDTSNLEELKSYLRNESSCSYHGLNYFIDANDEVFKILAKESMMSKDYSVRRFAFDIIIYRNHKNSDIKFLKIKDVYNHILNNLDNNYEEFINKLLSLNEINDFIVDELLDDYGDIVYLDKILEMCKDADSFTLKRSWDEYDEVGYKVICNERIEYFDYNENDLREMYPNYDQLYNELYTVVDEMFKEHFENNTIGIGQDKLFENNKSLNSYIKLYHFIYGQILHKYDKEFSIKRFNMPIEIGIKELDDNIISMQRIQEYRKYEWPKVRLYKFKLNDDTKKWLIEKKRFVIGDELIDLHLYNDAKLLYESKTDLDKEKFYV